MCSSFWAETWHAYVLLLLVQVYKAKRHGATVVALKMLVAEGSQPGSDFVKALELELGVLRNAHHPHIVNCFGVCVQVWVVGTKVLATVCGDVWCKRLWVHCGVRVKRALAESWHAHCMPLQVKADLTANVCTEC